MKHSCIANHASTGDVKSAKRGDMTGEDNLIGDVRNDASPMSSRAKGEGMVRER
jgi:hypothetical protein